jgi:hypothetical protein
MCIECGATVDTPVSTNSYSDLYKDKNRRHLKRASEDKKTSIIKELEGKPFSPEVRELANNMYIEITKGLIKRGQNRLAVIVACLHHAILKNNKLNRTSHNTANNNNSNILYDFASLDELTTMFKLTDKQVSKGFCVYYTFYPNDNKEAMSAESYIRNGLYLFRDLIDCKKIYLYIDELMQMHDIIHNKTEILNRSNIKSVIAGLIYHFFVHIIQIDIPMEEYCKQIKLSEATINKIVNSIKTILT